MSVLRLLDLWRVVGLSSDVASSVLCVRVGDGGKFGERWENKFKLVKSPTESQAKHRGPRDSASERASTHGSCAISGCFVSSAFSSFSGSLPTAARTGALSVASGTAADCAAPVRPDKVDAVLSLGAVKPPRRSLLVTSTRSALRLAGVAIVTCHAHELRFRLL